MQRLVAGLERLAALLQYLLLQHRLSLVMHRFMAIREPRIRNLQIDLFRRLFEVDMEEAAEPDTRRHPDFNAFFTRALKAEARPLAHNSRLLCPADGTLSALGTAHAARLVQAKGHSYTLHALLGGDVEAARPYINGAYATVYLSPGDYHRVHMPVRGTLRRMVYIPGRLFSVNAATTRNIPGLFARNERLVCLFDTRYGPMALVLVGAIFVGSMETVWAGKVTPLYGKAMQAWDYTGDEAVTLKRGAEMGRFNMGSTVILLWPGSVDWEEGLAPETHVRMGQGLGLLPRGNARTEKP
ncbi:MAG: archaetidylserine decarboxylase [Gammaproteobacteria bacterium]|nr:archaetidylserine decarboxylase [Gammaproteobacteria bacterium]